MTDGNRIVVSRTVANRGRCRLAGDRMGQYWQPQTLVGDWVGPMVHRLRPSRVNCNDCKTECGRITGAALAPRLSLAPPRCPHSLRSFGAGEHRSVRRTNLGPSMLMKPTLTNGRILLLLGLAASSPYPCEGLFSPGAEGWPVQIRGLSARSRDVGGTEAGEGRWQGRSAEKAS